MMLTFLYPCIVVHFTAFYTRLPLLLLIRTYVTYFIEADIYLLTALNGIHCCYRISIVFRDIGRYSSNQTASYAQVSCPGLYITSYFVSRCSYTVCVVCVWPHDILPALDDPVWFVATMLIPIG